MNAHTYVWTFRPLIAVFFIGTVAVPAAFPYFFAKDLFLRDATRRRIPLFFTAGMYVLSTLVFLWLVAWQMDSLRTSRFANPTASLGAAGAIQINYLLWLVPQLLALLLSQIVGLLLAAAISIRFKISLHAMGIGLVWAFFLNPVLWPMQILDYGLWPVGEFVSSSVKVSYESAYHLTTILTFIGLILVTVILIWQRYVSGSHAGIQLLVGFSSGLAGTLLCLRLTARILDFLF